MMVHKTALVAAVVSLFFSAGCSSGASSVPARDCDFLKGLGDSDCDYVLDQFDKAPG
jgi:hypothetical protein